MERRRFLQLAAVAPVAAIAPSTQPSTKPSTPLVMELDPAQIPIRFSGQTVVETHPVRVIQVSPKLLTTEARDRPTGTSVLHLLTRAGTSLQGHRQIWLRSWSQDPQYDHMFIGSIKDNLTGIRSGAITPFLFYTSGRTLKGIGWFYKHDLPVMVMTVGTKLL
jgi:hypothetical protein